MVIAGPTCTLRIENEVPMYLPQGMVGFDRARQFVLSRVEHTSDFYWLRSLDRPGLAFLVVDPSLYFVDYDIEMLDEYSQALGIQTPEDVALLTVATPATSGHGLTVNLLAPIAVNKQTLVGLQLVPRDSCYSSKHPLPRVKLQPRLEVARLAA